MVEGHHHRYDLYLSEKLADPELELYCFLNDHPPEKGGLGKVGHFRRFAEMVWGKESSKPFIWHPWAERMLEDACKYKYLGLIGCGNSGKTDFCAIWAIINWLAARYTTKVFVTSTSLKESRKRIWGAVREYYLAAGWFPGKLIDSIGQIRSGDLSNPEVSDRSGIELIAGERKKEKDAVGKMIGVKNQRMFVIADELPELSEAILSACFGNLALNPHFQLIGVGNFASTYDPLGVFVAPKQGWNSITEEDHEWDTERGKCLRFDGLKSPNILSGRDDYPFIYSSKDLREHQRTLGVNTAQFWRMCRSFPCPEADDNIIFSEQDLNRGKVHDRAVWLEPPITIASLDPGFTTGGDKSVAIIADYGRNTDGVNTISLRIVKELQENVSEKLKPRNMQIAEQFVALCKDNGVPPRLAAYDNTSGAGILFGELLWQFWSPKLLGVNFGGTPSDRPVSFTDGRKAKDAYRNRVTELWYSALEFVRASQIRGMPLEMARQLKSRKKRDVKVGTIKEVIESKTDMKARVGYSPDHADAFVILVELVRTRLGGSPALLDSAGKRRGSSWEHQSRLVDDIYNETFSDAAFT